MNQITADETLRARLHRILEPVEVRDEEGRLMGHYTPVSSAEEAEITEFIKRASISTRSNGESGRSTGRAFRRMYCLRDWRRLVEVNEVFSIT